MSIEPKKDVEWMSLAAGEERVWERECLAFAERYLLDRESLEEGIRSLTQLVWEGRLSGRKSWEEMDELQSRRHAYMMALAERYGLFTLVRENGHCEFLEQGPYLEEVREMERDLEGEPTGTGV